MTSIVSSVIGRSRLLARAQAFGAVAGVLLALLVVAGSSSAVGPVDMRGSWACVAEVGSARYPQTITITSQSFTTGRIVGTDVGGGMTFNVTGTVTGNRFAMVVSRSGYTSKSSGKVGGVSPRLSFSGSFTDSNRARGSFSCKMTSAVATPKPSAVASSAPAQTPSATVLVTLPTEKPVVETPAPTDAAPTATPQASNAAALGPEVSPDAGGAGPVIPPETPPPSGSDPLPIILGLGALTLIGGLLAAALGLVPGVPGMVGSSGAAPAPGVQQAVDQTLQAAQADSMLKIQTDVASQVTGQLGVQQAVDQTLQAAQADSMLKIQTDVASQVTGQLGVQQAVDQTLQAAQADSMLKIQTDVASQVTGQLGVQQAVDQTLQAAQADSMLKIQTDVASQVTGQLGVQQAVDQTLQAAQADSMLKIQTDVASQVTGQLGVQQAPSVGPDSGGTPAP